MDYRTVLAEVESWPIDDRLRLLQEVWDQMVNETDDLELTEELQALLDRRLAALETTPDDVIRWDEIKSFVRRPR